MSTKQPAQIRPDDNPQPERRASNLILKCDYREAEFEHWPRPEPLQLAQLAAQLAHPGKDNPQELIQSAWALYWEGCRQLKEDYQQVEALLARMEEWEAQAEVVEPAPTFAQPKQYPVTFQEVELLLLPHLKGRTAERARLFRTYIRERAVSPSYMEGSTKDRRSRLVGGRLPAPTPDEEAAIFGRWRRGRYNEEQYVGFAEDFLRWFHRHADQQTRAVKAANARRGWEKRRKEKKDKLGARPKLKALRAVLASAA
jgi:hypothetical protein